MNKITIALITTALTTAACTNGGVSPALLGGITGSAAGGLIGGAAGGSKGAAIGALAGAAAGGLLAAYLDTKDQETAAAAQAKALNAPLNKGGETSTNWKSDHNPGVSGVVKVSDAGQSGNKECRTVSNIVNANGKENTVTSKLCKDPTSGAWV